MGPKKAKSILKRSRLASDAPGGPPKPAKRAKPSAGAPRKPSKHHSQRPRKHAPLPQLASVVHSQAAHAVGRLLQADATRQGGVAVKSLTLAPHIQAKKATHAVTCRTLQHLPALQPVVAAAGLLEAGIDGLTPEVAYVLVYETLFGEGLKRSGHLERAVLKHKAALESELASLLKARGPLEQLLSPPGAAASWPRSARVNTIKISVAEALAWLRSPPAEHASFAGKGEGVQVDDVLPDVLLFPAGTDLHDHPLVRQGALVLQSRASCMTAHALAPRPGWHVIDGCAAPGNKTTHLAALMGNRGTIHAFDKDARRLERLRANAAAAGASCIHAQVANILAVDPKSSPELADVHAVLLDPSCSGSGTVQSRGDHLLPSFVAREQAESEQGSVPAPPPEDTERVEALARFQEAALRHLLRLPRLRRLAYSTCSIWPRENELVVAAVMPEARALGFKLACALPAWPRRGLPGLVERAELLVRTDPALDQTDGFFVALFEREVPDDKQPS